MGLSEGSRRPNCGLEPFLALTVAPMVVFALGRAASSLIRDFSQASLDVESESRSHVGSRCFGVFAGIARTAPPVSPHIALLRDREVTTGVEDIALRIYVAEGR